MIGLAPARKWKQWLGLDRALSYVLAGRAWSVIAGPITILLIGSWFTVDQQGLFYTFHKVLGLQVFLELGLNQCLMQFASHEFARLRFEDRGRVVGDPIARNRLLALGRLALKWYAFLALLVVVLIGAGGHAFFATVPDSARLQWRAGWWLLIVVTGANLMTQPVWFLLEGCYQVAFVAGCRAVAAVAGALVMWAGMAAGGGLLAPGLAAGANLIVGVTLLSLRWRGFVSEILGHRSDARGILRELWPFQWRLALSAMSAYLAYSLFEPTLYYLRGPAEAGRMGMSWQLTNALNMLCVAWISTQAPRFGNLVSQGRHAELGKLVRRVATRAVLVCTVGAITLVGLLGWVKANLAIGDRFLGLGAVGLLAGTTIINQVVYAQMYYLRAHKQDPFMQLAVLNGVLTATGVIWATWRFGAFGACAAYAAVQLLILPLATWVFVQKRREWRVATSEPLPAPPGRDPSPFA